ncbi:MAG: hypothetical protein CVT79_05270 [Alphaproteobacteria bacterium HGW-Alphaproteobacteria-18]|nr:MAG: hypothetical protein CVT79_05270 [Alphaproteobacteria bacterium HGW-Alphaproteobacteria-18]
MIRKILLAFIAAALAFPLSAFAQVPPPIRVTAKGKEVVPVLVSQPLPEGAQLLSTPVLQVCHGGGNAVNAVILSGDLDFDETDNIETVVVPGQCVFISARLVRLTTNTDGASTAILVQLVR